MGEPDPGAIAKAVLKRYPKSHADELNLNLGENTPSVLFQWLIVALVCSARIAASQAIKAAEALFDQQGWRTPQKMAETSWQDRVDVLNQAGYARYDESTARYIGETTALLMDAYGGDLRKLREAANGDSQTLRELLKQFKGIGEVGADIFCREAQLAWQELYPFADKKALDAAAKLHLPTRAGAMAELVPRRDLPRLLSGLVRADLAGETEALLRAATRIVGQGAMAETEDDILEEGNIFFLYRPQVDEEDPDRLSDVQRFYMVLRPRGGRKLRLLVVGRKRLPDVKEHERHWGFVDMVAQSGKEIEQELREDRYETASRGERRLPAVRPAGEGVYALSVKDGQMHLAYALELPDDPGPVQTAFKIAPEAAFALSIKNPEAGQPKAAGLSGEQKADYPDKLQELFRDRRFAQEDARLLDYEGAEFIMVGARTKPHKDVSLALDPDQEDDKSADMLRKLRMVKSRHPVEPLFKGDWA